MALAPINRHILSVVDPIVSKWLMENRTETNNKPNKITGAVTGNAVTVAANGELADAGFPPRNTVILIGSGNPPDPTGYPEPPDGVTIYLRYTP